METDWCNVYSKSDEVSGTVYMKNMDVLVYFGGANLTAHAIPVACRVGKETSFLNIVMEDMCLMSCCSRDCYC